MTNHQCYCYGIIAINNLLSENVQITSDSFFNELYYFWDIYSEDEIDFEYSKKLEENIML